MAKKENGTLQDQLLNVVIDNKKSGKQEGLELEEIRFEYAKNKERFEKLFNIIKDVNDVGDEILDGDVKKKFDENLERAIENADKFIELEFIDDVTSSRKIIAKQNDLMGHIKELLEEMADLTNVHIIPEAMPDMKESNDKSNQNTETIGDKDTRLILDDNFDVEESDDDIDRSVKDDETLEHSINENTQKESIYFVGTLSETQRDAVIANIRLISERYEGVDKKDQVGTYRFWESVKKEMMEGKTFEVDGKVQSGAFEPSIIEEYGLSKKDAELVFDTVKNNIIATDLDRLEYVQDAFMDFANNAQRLYDNKQISDMINNVKDTIFKKQNTLKTFKKEKIQKEFIEHLIEYIESEKEAIEQVIEQKKEHDKTRPRKKNKKIDRKIEPLNDGGNKRESIINKEIEELFNSFEIQEYIDTGDSKKTKRRQKHIEDYKKEIIESIVEIERASGREIFLEQFALDYANDKNATAVARELEKHIKSEQSIDNNESADVDLEGMQKTRDAAQITLDRFEKNEHLNAATVEQGDEKFKRVTRQVWKEIVVHGKLQKNRETGEIEFKNITDEDGRMALALLKKAGIKKTNVTYVPQGEFEKGKINIDTGNLDGLVILDDGTVIMDHHGENSGNNSSGTKILYDTLTRLGVLEKTDDLDRAVDFVNKIDNYDLPKEYFKNYFKNSWKTLVGLRGMTDGATMLRFFAYRDESSKELLPTQALSSELLREFGFMDKAQGQKMSKMERHRDGVYKARTELDRLKERGFIVESVRYGKICIDVNQKLNNDAVKASGYDTYIKWSKDQNSFFISSLVGKDIKEDFSQGKSVRKTMWMKSRGDGEELTMQLKEVLEKMTDGKLKPSEALQKALDSNGERTDRVELSIDEKRRIDIYIKHTKETLEFIKDMVLAEFGITKQKDIRMEKQKLVQKAWQELGNDIEKGTSFTSGQAKDIIDIIKDRL